MTLLPSSLHCWNAGHFCNWVSNSTRIMYIQPAFAYAYWIIVQQIFHLHLWLLIWIFAFQCIETLMYWFKKVWRSNTYHLSLRSHDCRLPPLLFSLWAFFPHPPTSLFAYTHCSGNSFICRALNCNPHPSLTNHFCSSRCSKQVDSLSFKKARQKWTILHQRTGTVKAEMFSFLLCLLADIKKLFLSYMLPA